MSDTLNGRVGDADRASQASPGAATASPPSGDYPIAQRWQPIETAPRDGTEIILAIQGAGHGRYWVHVGWWNEGDQFPWRFIDCFALEPIGCCDGEDDDRISVNGAREAGVTHWMPLPAAPVSA